MPIDEEGNFYLEKPESTREKKDAKPKRKTLGEYQKIYDFEKGRHHPWVMYLRAIPMGENGQVPMNHSLEVLNNMAIHLERIGFTEPDPERREIQYQKADSGPDVVWNPGTWVDKDAVVPEHLQDGAPLPEIDLTGVPPEQLAVLQRAIKAEQVRLAKTSGADLRTQVTMDPVPTKDLTTVFGDPAAAETPPEEATE